MYYILGDGDGDGDSDGDDILSVCITRLTSGTTA